MFFCRASAKYFIPSSPMLFLKRPNVVIVYEERIKKIENIIFSLLDFVLAYQPGVLPHLFLCHYKKDTMS